MGDWVITTGLVPGVPGGAGMFTFSAAVRLSGWSVKIFSHLRCACFATAVSA